MIFKKINNFISKILFKDIYTLTISELSYIEETNNINVICKTYLPNILCIRAYNRISEEIRKQFDQKKRSITNEKLQLVIYVRLGMLESMLLGLSRKPTDEMYTDYKIRYKKEFKRYEDLAPIKREIKKLKSKYKEVTIKINNTKKNESNDEKLTFKDVLNNIEIILDKTFDKDMKIYQFALKYKSANDKVKQFELAKAKSKMKSNVR